jgi:hypothetical protein
VLDQVGVNAPGKPTRTTFLPAQKLVKSTFSGGKPLSRLTAGIASPMLTLKDLALNRLKPIGCEAVDGVTFNAVLLSKVRLKEPPAALMQRLARMLAIPMPALQEIWI